MWLWGHARVFLVALTRGVLGIKVFSKQGVMPGETPEGAGLLVSHLPALLKMMLGSGAGLPRTNVSGHDPSFFHRKWGTITGDYESACRECGFKPWAGTNSKKGPRAQPREIGDVLLHETVIWRWAIKPLWSQEQVFAGYVKQNQDAPLPNLPNPNPKIAYRQIKYKKKLFARPSPIPTTKK